MEIYISQWLLFILIFARVASLIAVAPVFGHPGVPVQLKVALSIFTAFVLYPIVNHHPPHIEVQLLSFMVLVLKEVVTGLIIGFATSLLFAGVQFAGQLIGIDMGFSIANVIDPESGTNTPIISQMQYVVVILIFLMVNGHHFLIESLLISFSAVPIDGFSLSGSLVQKLIALTGTIFTIAVKIGAPAIIALFLTNVALGVLSRAVPQMNVFVISFPLKIAVGFLVLIISLPAFVYVFKKLLMDFENNIVELIRLI
jgi:flagellar biosynthetic protein FliR